MARLDKNIKNAYEIKEQANSLAMRMNVKLLNKMSEFLTNYLYLRSSTSSGTETDFSTAVRPVEKYLNTIKYGLSSGRFSVTSFGGK